MVEVNITRSEIITVDKVWRNEFEDLLFTDKGGKEHKVSNKRAKWFDGIVLPNTAVKLNFAEAYGKEYIYNAQLVEGELPITEPLAKKPAPELPAGKTAPQSIQTAKDEQIWKSVCIKELGECIRSGNLDVTKPKAKLIRLAYYGLITTGSGIDIDLKGD